MIATTIAETAGTLISLLGNIQTLNSGRRKPHREHERLVEALRGIYFTPYGTQNILEKLARGERPTREDVEDLLPRFNDAEWRVRDYIQFLESDELFRSRSIALRDSRILREIAYGKRDIRRHIQDLINEALTLNKPVDTQEAALALKAVQALNASIELIEAMYNRNTP